MGWREALELARYIEEKGRSLEMVEMARIANRSQTDWTFSVVKGYRWTVQVRER